MTRPKHQPQRLALGGFTFEVDAPYCTCTTPDMGHVRREDGVWVKPCCRRVTCHIHNLTEGTAS